MSFLKDPVHERPDSTGLARELADFLESDASGRREPEFARAGESRDAEAVELVGRFEQLYAELNPPPEPRPEPLPDDDLVVEVPDELPGADTPYWAPVFDAPARDAPGADARVADTFVLTRPEKRTPSVAHPAPLAAMPADDADPRGHEPVARQAPGDTTPDEDAQDWSTNARRGLWPRVMLAAGIALTVGVGGGYFAGKTGGPAAEIQTSPDGGARLRTDYDLRTR